MRAEQTTPEKFAKVLALVANTSNPGEALNALEIVLAILKAHGRDWNDLCERVRKSDLIIARQHASKPATPSRPEKGARAKQWARERNARKAAEIIRKYELFLTGFERLFLEQVIDTPLMHDPFGGEIDQILNKVRKERERRAPPAKSG